MNDYTPPLPGPARPGDTAAPLSRGEVALKIITVDGPLKSIRTPIRTEGEVTNISRDGKTATIQTDQGEIEVRLRGREGLEPGQKIQIDLQAGSPPRQMIIRPAPESAQRPAPAQDQPPLPTTPQAQTRPAPETTQTKPAPVSLPPVLREVLDSARPATPQTAQAAGQPVTTQGTAQTAPTALPPLPLLPDAVVRLIPLHAPLPPAALLPPVDIPATLPQQLTIANTALPPDLMTAPAQPIQTTAKTPPIPTTPPGTTAPPGNIALLPTGGEQPAESSGFSALGKIPDFFAHPVQSILLPIMKQVQPFITPLTTGGAAQTESPGAATPPAGNTPLYVKILSIVTAPTAETPVKILPGATMHASVIATTKQHFPVLSVQNAQGNMPGQNTNSFLLQFAASNIPVGTQMELTPYPLNGDPLNPGQTIPGTGQTSPATPTLAPAMTATPIGTLLSGWTWPALDDAYQLLSASILPSAAHSTTAPLIPNPGTPQSMPSAILFFMAALGAGDLSGWMGEKGINALRREGAKGADILNRITRDFSGLSRAVDEPVTQDWRGMAIPMLWQNEVTKIHLFYRHQDSDQDPDEDRDGERSTRFLFDLDLSRIGPLQLDGYMKEKRMDLILRSQTPFSHPMQQQMRELYLGILEQGGLTGDLGFQNRPDQWVRVDVRQAALQTSV